MRRKYQYNKRQSTNNYNGNTGYNGSNNGSGNQFGSYQAQISKAQSVLCRESVIYPTPLQIGTHMIPPPPPRPQYISVNRVNQFQQQEHYDNNTQISAITAGGSILGGRNEQASLQSCNNNNQVQNVLSK